MHFPNDGVVDGKAFCFVWFKEDNDGAKAIEGLKDKYSVADGKVRQHSRARGTMRERKDALALAAPAPPPPMPAVGKWQLTRHARASSVRARRPQARTQC